MKEFDVKFVNDHLNLFFINPDYLKELHRIDSEVYFDNSYYRDNKPGVGLLLNLSEEFRYLIPLSSAKEKHTSLKNVGRDYFLVYEIVNKQDNYENAIYKDLNDDGNTKMHILALLDLKKMIPVIDGVYEKIDFNLLEEKKRDLYRKEYRYLLSKKSAILRKAKDLYIKRAREYRKIKFCCDFNRLENYIRDKRK